MPNSRVIKVSDTVALVKSLSSRMILSLALAGKDFCNSGKALRTSSAMLTTFPSELLVIEMRTILSSVVCSAALK